MREKRCPLCGNIVRSDASLRLACALCGMGIPVEAHRIVIDLNHERLSFCSIDCLLAHPAAAEVKARA